MGKESHRVWARRPPSSPATLDLMRSYAYHVFSSLWRRRLVILLVLAVFTAFMFLVQYKSLYGESGQSHTHTVGGQRTLRTFDGRSNNASERLVDHQSSYQQQRQTVVGEVQSAEAERNPRGRERHVQAASAETGIGQKHLASSGGKYAKVERVHSVEMRREATNEEEGDQLLVGRPRQKNQWSESNSIDNKIDRSQIIENKLKVEPYVPARRLFHLDLKGAPPKISYLEKLIPLVKKLGATGLLIEYEDMFPYDEPLRAISARNHYSRHEVRSLLKLAKKHDLDVIPLVQTFGHLEFVLKLEQFQGLREVPTIPQALCPSRNESQLLVQHMIDQVLALHPDARWIHIGCDEVFQLGVCPVCRQKLREDVFLQHVAHTASYVRSKHGVIPIVWDDMFHHLSAEMVLRYDLGNLVEPMLWTYVADIYRFISGNVWSMYAEVFPYIWAASAFKGAFGETLSVPDVKRHLENNLAWVEVLAREQSRFREIRGLALTGWQRYDHFATLCELLPAAVPSLAVNLLATSHGYFNESLQHNLYETLQCMKSQRYTTFLDLETDPYLWNKMSWCFFPGVSFFKATERLAGVKKVVAEYLKAETINKAWLTEYNVRHNFSSITRIEVTMQEFPRYYYDVETLIKQSRDALREVFDEYTVAEWIEQNVYPMLRKLELLQQAAESMKRANTWPVRPFDTLPDLQRYNIGIPDDGDS